MRGLQGYLKGFSQSPGAVQATPRSSMKTGIRSHFASRYLSSKLLRSTTIPASCYRALQQRSMPQCNACETHHKFEGGGKAGQCGGQTRSQKIYNVHCERIACQRARVPNPVRGARPSWLCRICASDVRLNFEQQWQRGEPVVATEHGEPEPDSEPQSLTAESLQGHNQQMASQHGITTNWSHLQRPAAVSEGTSVIEVVLEIGNTVFARDIAELREIGIGPNTQGLVTVVHDDQCEIIWEKFGEGRNVVTNTPKKWLRTLDERQQWQ